MPKQTPEAQIDGFIEQVIECRATDLLLTAGAPPLVRVDGKMRSLMPDAKPLRPDECDTLANALMNEPQHAAFRANKDVDFSFNWRDQARFRANVFRQRSSTGVALRFIPYQIPTFDSLGIPATVREFVKQPHGLVLVTGPTGSGKSTTLASMIDWINHNRELHILTIEDPIEYHHTHKLSAVNQREIGDDASSFGRALRAALRENPDVLLVGEMRDAETIQTTLTIAETGHLVLATLHTNDTAQAVDRIIDVFPPEQQQQIRVQLASTLTGIVYQQLIPRVGGGRVAGFEVLVASHAVRNLIKEGKSRQIRNVLSTGAREGMQTLEESLTQLVARGVVRYEDAIARSVHPGEIRKPR